MWYTKKLLTAILAGGLLVSLAGCASTTTGQSSREDKIDSVMAKAAADAKGKGNAGQSLSYLEQIYKRNSSDPSAAQNYAHALREEGFFSRASLILKPFATQDNVKDAGLLIEYASIQTSMGNHVDAEQTARKAVLLDPTSGRAYHLLGIALDAQGHHEQAQTAFEKGLEHWEGDPSAILNNMGLNLAAQGFLDEAIETLRKALDTAPNRMEIERNLRIISALQYQPPKEGTRLVPKPPRKPESEDKRQAKILKNELDSNDGTSESTKE